MRQKTSIISNESNHPVTILLWWNIHTFLVSELNVTSNTNHFKFCCCKIIERKLLMSDIFPFFIRLSKVYREKSDLFNSVELNIGSNNILKLVIWWCSYFGQLKVPNRCFDRLINEVTRKFWISKYFFLFIQILFNILLSPPTVCHTCDLSESIPKYIN